MLMTKFDLSRLELGQRRLDRAASTPASEVKGKSNTGKAKRLLKGDDPKSLFQQLKIDVRPSKKHPGAPPEHKGMIRAKAIVVPFAPPISRELLEARQSGQKRGIFLSLGEKKKPTDSRAKVAGHYEPTEVIKRSAINIPVEPTVKDLQTDASLPREKTATGKSAAVELPIIAMYTDKPKAGGKQASLAQAFQDNQTLRVEEPSSKQLRPITRSFDLTRSKGSGSSVVEIHMRKQSQSLNTTGDGIADLNSRLPQNKTMQHRTVLRPPTVNSRQASRDLKTSEGPSTAKPSRENTRNQKRNIILNLLQPADSKILQSRLRFGQFASKPSPEADLMKSRLYYVKDVFENFYKEGYEEDEYSRVVKKSVLEMFKAFRARDDFAVQNPEDLEDKTVNVKPLLKPGLPVLVLDIDETLIHARTSIEAFKDYELTIEMRLGQIFFVAETYRRSKSRPGRT